MKGTRHSPIFIKIQPDVMTVMKRLPPGIETSFINLRNETLNFQPSALNLLMKFKSSDTELAGGKITLKQVQSEFVDTS